MKFYYDYQKLPELRPLSADERQRAWQHCFWHGLRDPLVLICLLGFGVAITYGMDLAESLGMHGATRLIGAIAGNLVAWLLLYPVILWRVRPRLRRYLAGLE